MSFLNKKALYSWLLAIGAVLIVVTTVLGATQKAMTTNTNFTLPLILVLAAGAAAALSNLFIRLDFMPLVTSFLFSAGFGMIFSQGLPIIIDRLNNISFQGGNFSCVAAYMIMAFIACVLSFIACFIKKNDD